MNWGSILVFLAIGIISSIFNKSKEQQRRGKSTQVRGATTKPQPSTTQQAKPRRTSGGLEDMLREFQRDINTVFGDLQPSNNSNEEKPIKNIEPVETELEVYEENYETVAEANYTTEDYTTEDYTAKVPEIKGKVYENEIGAESKPSLSFNNKSLVEGIIMAEVLGKPKSLQRT